MFFKHFLTSHLLYKGKRNFNVENDLPLLFYLIRNTVTLLALILVKSFCRHANVANS